MKFLTPVIFFCLFLANTANAGDIKNMELQGTIAPLSECETMEAPDKCAEALVTQYKKDNNLYAHINYSMFAAQYFKGGITLNSPDKIIKYGIQEEKEAEEWQAKDIDSIDKQLKISSIEADIFSMQEEESAKIARNFSRMIDMKMLSVSSFSVQNKGKIATLNILFSVDMNKRLGSED